MRGDDPPFSTACHKFVRNYYPQFSTILRNSEGVLTCQRLTESGGTSPVCAGSEPPATCPQGTVSGARVNDIVVGLCGDSACALTPTTSVAYQSDECARPVKTAPLRAGGIRPPLMNPTTRTPPSQKVCLPPPIR